MIQAPKHLDEPARKKWRAIVGILQQRGDVIDQAIEDTVALYATAWSRWTQAEAEIAKLGAIVRSQIGTAIVNPWLSVSATAFRQVVRLGAELKLTPKHRGRITKTKPEQDDSGGDFLDALKIRTTEAG